MRTFRLGAPAPSKDLLDGIDDVKIVYESREFVPNNLEKNNVVVPNVFVRHCIGQDLQTSVTNDHFDGNSGPSPLGLRIPMPIHRSCNFVGDSHTLAPGTYSGGSPCDQRMTW